MYIISDVPIWVWAYIGIVIGVACRTIIPYLQAIQLDPSITFQWEYVGTAIGSAFFTGLLIMPTFTIPDAEPYLVLFLAIAFAYMTNEAMNRRVDKHIAIKKAHRK